MVRHAADALPFHSIMVDMSHYEKAENLAKTKELVAYCHERGIATEAEPGRIEGGEDGIADTDDLAGMLTTPEEAEEIHSHRGGFPGSCFWECAWGVWGSRPTA